MSKVRKYDSPRLLMPSSFDLPPVECCLGTSPSHAASCLPSSNFFAFPMVATNALAVIGPMPRIFSSLQLTSFSRCQV